MANRRKTSASVANNGVEVDNSSLPVLSLSDIRRINDSVPVRAARVDLLGDGSQMGLIHYKPASSGDTIRLSESKPGEQVKAAVEYVARIACNPDGTSLFSEDDLKQMSSDVVQNIMLGIIRARSSEGGKGKNV